MRQLGFILSILFTNLCLGNNNLTSSDSLENVPVATSSAVWTIMDSLTYIPAYDEYCGFDVKNIWNKKTDLSKMSDTAFFVLQYDSCDFKAPIIGRLTSDFGWRHSKPHYGLDVKCEVGDSISTVFEGMVRISQYSSTYGNVVVVRHQNGLESLYAHLSKRLVEEGDMIEVGTTIGLGGNTGRSFGSHLHFEVRYLGEPINPTDIFEVSDSSFALKSSELHLNAEHFEFLKDVRKVKYHTVRSGDTLYRISRRYGVSVSSICKLNGISKNKTLRIGQRLRYH